MRIAIIGFGLIGGSIARAAGRSAGDRLGSGHEIAAWSPGRSGPEAALAAGLIAQAPDSLEATLDGAQLVILAAPPLACLDLLETLAGPAAGSLALGATITDVASTKTAIVEAADRHGLAFVGGHPMAGSERTGFEAARADLFVDRPWVVCPGRLAGPVDVERVEALARSCGARPVRLEPALHDRATAGISHVPLVVSAALVEATTGDGSWSTAIALAAGGWRDMSRLAAGDPAMGAGIAATNAGPIAAGLRGVRDALDEWIVELERVDPDPEAFRLRLATARDRLGRP